MKHLEGNRRRGRRDGVFWICLVAAAVLPAGPRPPRRTPKARSVPRSG